MSLRHELRQYVIERAGSCCEYCRLGEDARFARFHIDHIVPRKHGGIDSADNLCLACSQCNAYKGSNVAALDPLTGQAIRLYHPRLDAWGAHFI